MTPHEPGRGSLDTLSVTFLVMNLGHPCEIWGVFAVFCEGLLTPPNYLRRDPSNVTDDTEAHHTAHTAAGLRHEEAVLPTRILVGKVAVTNFVTHKHPFRRISRIPPSGSRGPLHVSVTWCV